MKVGNFTEKETIKAQLNFMMKLSESIRITQMLIIIAELLLGH